MSISALDQLLLSIAGARPPLAAAAKKRDPFSTHELLLPTPFHRRDRHQPTTHHTKLSQHQQKQQRRRQHSAAPKFHLYPQPQPALSLRLYGLKNNGWPRTLLAALRVDVDELSGSQRSGSRGLSVDSNVRLFFDGFMLQTAGKTASSQAAAVTQSRFPWRRPAATKSRPLLQIAVDPSQECGTATVGIPVDREIELVRSRRKSPRRMSCPTNRRSRRHTSYDPRDVAREAKTSGRDKDEDQMMFLQTHSTEDLDRVEAAIDAATESAMRIVAAEANAQLSFELMERKASSHTHYAATHGAQHAVWGLDAQSVELQPSQDGSLVADRPSEDPCDELDALRAENAEQKALIRQLLIENRRLLQQEQHNAPPPSAASTHDVSVPSKRKRLSDPSQDEERNRGASSASTASSTSMPISRRSSLTFSVIDGYETFVDHKFDHLVSEITSEIAELLSEDALLSTSSPTSINVAGAGGR